MISLGVASAQNQYTFLRVYKRLISQIWLQQPFPVHQLIVLTR